MFKKKVLCIKKVLNAVLPRVSKVNAPVMYRVHVGDVDMKATLERQLVLLLHKRRNHGILLEQRSHARRALYKGLECEVVAPDFCQKVESHNLTARASHHVVGEKNRWHLKKKVFEHFFYQER